MLLTGTVHPPGGASAVLAATSPDITDMGWYFVGLVMWGTTLMLIVGLVINNIQRQFPMYWWTPLPVRETRRKDAEVWPRGDGGFEEEKKESDLEEETQQITISALGVTLPESLALNGEEAELLERLRNRLGKKSAPSERSMSSGSTANMTMVPTRDAARPE
ncbi:hypothetical protein GRF29_161g1242217 [Pseudopithomyces chartarum]|uniref:HPP transmembrane region domain-containing protein n=1 Tax=Pseudopithomyces chartarum TaxID=1892770 RepID=A0AAN6LQA5_9PLEO|nr:hypothetical protein GRF29_161g1242217 [Pseudopithomyces chartarum]